MSDRPLSTEPERIDRERPPWLVRVLDSRGGTAGTGVAVDGEHVITCAHVIDPTPNAPANPERRIQLQLPFSGSTGTLTARALEGAWFPVRSDGSGDLAVLRLTEPVGDLTPAPLKRIPCTPGTEVEARGFPDDQPVNRTSQGRLSNASRPEWVQVDPVGARGWAVKPGFSGGPVWDRKRGAVIGLTVARDGGDSAHMLPMRYLCELWPALAERLRPIPPAPERDLSHWWPRARGVSSSTEEGWLFRGRERALTEIKDWLETGRRHTVLVVTGTPGTGKSAVLGRMVTTSHRPWADRLPEQDTAVRAEPGSIDCAVHAKDQTALEVAEAILARAEGGHGERRLENLAGFPSALAEALAEAEQFNLVLDALDEAAEARQIVTGVLRPLAEAPRTKVIVGTRKLDAHGDLLAHFGRGRVVIDLDAPSYFELRDLSDYAEAALRQASGEQTGSGPYADPRVAARVASRIAELSEGNFLVAGLVARSRGRYDGEPVDPEDLTFTADVSVAFWNHLKLLEPLEGIEAEALLTALAFTEAPGFTVQLWATAIQALEGREVNPRRLTNWAGREAANFLTVSGTGDDRSFRLFHQALVEACRERQAHIETSAETESALTEAFLDLGMSEGWEQAPSYLWHSLPGHADRADRIDDLLGDLEFLVVADPARLVPALSRVTGDKSSLHATIYRVSSGHLHHATFRERRSLLAYNAARCRADDARESLAGTTERGGLEWKPIWATGNGIDPRSLLSIPTYGLMGQLHCTTMAGRPIAITASADRDSLDAWDLTSGDRLFETRTPYQGPISALDSIATSGRTLVVAANEMSGVSVVDLATGTVDRVISHQGLDAVTALACTEIDGRPTVVYGGLGGRLWMTDLDTGYTREIESAGNAEILELACVVVDAGTLITSIDDEGALTVWELTAERQHRTVLSRTEGLNLWSAKIDAAVVDGTPLAVVDGTGGPIEIWDLKTHRRRGVLDARYPRRFTSITSLELDGHLKIVASDRSGNISIWHLDPSDDYQESRPSQVFTAGDFTKVDSVLIGRRMVLAALDSGGIVQVLSPNASLPSGFAPERSVRVDSLATLSGMGWSWVVTASASGNIAIRDVDTGMLIHDILRPDIRGDIRGIELVALGDIPLLVALTSDGEIGGIPMDTLHPLSIFDIGYHWYLQFTCTEIDGRPIVIASEIDGSLQVWDLIEGEPLHKIASNPIFKFRGLDTLRIQGERHAIALDDGGEIRAFKISNGNAESVISSVDLVRYATAFSCTELRQRSVAAIGDFNTVSIVDLESQEVTADIVLPDRVKELSFTDDGRLAVLSGQDVSVFQFTPDGLPSVCRPVPPHRDPPLGR